MKFISYKNWLNEKFVDDTDPIHDLGIGIPFTKVKENDIIQFKEPMYVSDRKLMFGKIEGV